MKRIRLYLSMMMLLTAGSVMAQDRLYADEFSLQHHGTGSALRR